jgi:spermidine synthase
VRAVTRRSLPLLCLCFFLSGFGSLILEVVWTRQLRLIFGSTTLAASTILVAYMLGLGIGGLVGGRLAHRLRNGLGVYGGIEIAIGLIALVVPFLLAALPPLARALVLDLGPWGLVLGRFAVALLVLLVPTILMGATLPIVVAAVTRDDPAIGARTGLLYGINTLGAVAGVFATAFVLFPWLGLWHSNVVGAVLDIAVGALALLLLGRATRASSVTAADAPSNAAAPSPAARAAPLLDVPPLGVLLTAYALVGFTALVYEVCWTRALALVLGSSIYAFSAMLGAFLAGIALGSLAVRGLVDRTRRPTTLLIAGLGALGVASLAVTLVLPLLPEAFLGLLRRTGPIGTRLVLLQVALCVVVQLPATLLLGALFPLLTRLVAATGTRAGTAVGRVYFANTLGCAIGAFLAGFVLIPNLGLRDTLALAAAINLLSAALVLLAQRTLGPTARVAAVLPIVCAAALLVVKLPFDATALTRGSYRGPELVLDFGIQNLPLDGVPASEVLFYRDGMNSTVSVHRLDSVRELRVNGKADASTGGDMSTQILLGQLPLLFGPEPERVGVIGYASGVTAGSVARHPVKQIDVIEIEPAILEAERFFDDANGRPLDDPRVHVVLDDGRAHLAASPGTYDVIISEPSNPWMSGVSNLFTREFFHIAREALRPRGRLLQWVQLYAMPPEDLYSILAALRAEFGYVYAFSYGEQEPDLLLLAMQEPLGRADLPHWEKLPPAVKYDLRRIGNFSTTDLWSLLRLLPADIDVLAQRAPLVNRDDNLHIELATPWLLGAMQGDDTLEPNWQAFAEFKQGALPLLRQVGEPMDADRVGALALSYMRARHDPTVAAALLAVAAKGGATPNTVAAALLLGRSLDNELSLENQLETIEQAVTQAPDALEPRLIRAELRIEDEQFEAALADANHALDVAADDPRALDIKARALRALGRETEALDTYVALLGTSQATFDRTLPQEQAELLLATGRPADAIPVLEGYLHEVRPGWQDGWLLLARAREQTGDPTGAKRARDNALAVEQNEIRRMRRQARISHWRGWDDVAIDLLQQVTTFDPNDAAAQAELAELRAAAPSPTPAK